MLPGLMMDYPLTLTAFLTRAKTFFPAAEVVSRLPDGRIHRYTYVDYCARAEKLCRALLGLGVVPGERLFIDQIPRTSTGKFKKLDLRARYGGHLKARTS